MICSEIPFENLQTSLAFADSILIISPRENVDKIIKQVKCKGGQKFTHMGYNEKRVAGKYDVAVIDGTEPRINPYAVFEEQYPYLKGNVLLFYIFK